MKSLNLYKSQIGDDGAEALLEAMIEGIADLNLATLDLGGFDDSCDVQNRSFPK